MTDLEEKIAAYNKERDKAVLGSLDDFIKFSEKYEVWFSSRQVALISQHKLRTAINATPSRMRQESIMWLERQGYMPWNDPDQTTTPKK